MSFGNWSLAQSQDWVSQKTLLAYPPMGAERFMLDRQAVASGQLQLSEWYGHQELTFARALRFNRLNLHFHLEDRALLWVLIDQTPNQRRGLLVSRHPNYPTSQVTLNSLGELTSSYVVSRERGREENHLIFKTSPSKGLMVDLNGESFFMEAQSEDSFVLSLRSGSEPVTVDSLEVEDGHKTTKISFMPPLRWDRVFWIFLFFSTFLGLVARFCLMRNRMFSAWLLGLILLTTMGSLRLFDLFYWSHLYAYQNEVPFTAKEGGPSYQLLEKWRIQLLSPWRREVSFFPPMEERVKKERWDAPPNPLMNAGFQWIQPDGSILYASSLSEVEREYGRPDVVFLGSSQLWGSGASSPQKTGASLVVQGLNQRSQKTLRGLNLSLMGARAQTLLPRYRDLLSWAHPRILLVNLGHNDAGGDLESFREALREILKLSQKQGVQVVFCLEGTSDQGPHHIQPSHFIMRELAQNHKIPLVDLSQTFWEPSIASKGLIWWDIIHFTNLGHHLWAQLVLSQVDWGKLSPNLF